jgi:hypothetical protein
VATVVTAVADPAAFRPDSAVADSSISDFGIGVAQGRHADIGEGAIYIVLLLAKRKPPTD